MRELYVIMYHYVRPICKSRYPGIKGMEYTDFVQQIDFLRNNFSFVTMEDVIKAFDGEVDIPSKAVLLTFDDGYIDCWNMVFPLLAKEGIQGSFFVSGEAVCGRKLMDVNCIQFVLAQGDANEIKEDLNQMLDEFRRNGADIPSSTELYKMYAVANRFDSKEVVYIKRMLQKVLPSPIRHDIVHKLFEKYSDISEDILVNELYMDINQLRLMKKSGMHIGIHGYEHIWGEDLCENEMRGWIDHSLESLADCIDADNWTMSYPFGSYNDGMIEYIQKRGCKLAFLSEVGRATIDPNLRYIIKRYDTNDFPPKGNGYIEL